MQHYSDDMRSLHLQPHFQTPQVSCVHEDDQPTDTKGNSDSVQDVGFEILHWFVRGEGLLIFRFVKPNFVRNYISVFFYVESLKGGIFIEILNVIWVFLILMCKKDKMKLLLSNDPLSIDHWSLQIQMWLSNKA